MPEDLLILAADLRRRGEAFALATVVRCERPTSAKPGAKALIRPDGSMTGWVGGACAEPVVAREALAALRDGRPRLVVLVGEGGRNPARTEGIVHLPMTCHSGGTLEIYVEPFLPKAQLVLVGHGPVIETLASLAGIAGFVLSVGMAVDANILIFERTKEELRSGKSLVSAVEAGFNRAWNSIFDSNMSSIITAGILFYFGSATIRGFALVLIIGVLVSMFTAVTLSRQMLRVLVHQPWARKARYYGVAEDEFLIAPPTARTRRQREASADV